MIELAPVSDSMKRLLFKRAINYILRPIRVSAARTLVEGVQLCCLLGSFLTKGGVREA